MTEDIAVQEIIDESLSSKVQTRVQVGGWLRYWHYLRPIKKSAFQSFRGDIYKDDRDEITGLRIYAKKVYRKCVLVDGIDDKIEQAPRAIRVDDGGTFMAVYDDKEFEELKLKGRLTPKRMTFESYKWSLDVYETFDELPACIIIGMENIWIADALVGDDIDNIQNMSEFPVGLLFDYGVEKSIQRSDTELVKRWSQMDLSGFQSIDTHKGAWQWQNGGRIVQTKACCAYDATRDYLNNILGIGLDGADRRWYVDQDRVEGSGLPLECTLAVLSELVEPYNVEIDRVWIAPLVWTEELDTWSVLLGREDDDLYAMRRQIDQNTPAPRILTSELPEGVALVICEKTGNGTGELRTPGHASYLSPRAYRRNGYDIAITYRRKQ